MLVRGGEWLWRRLVRIFEVKLTDETSSTSSSQRRIEAEEVTENLSLSGDLSLSIDQSSVYSIFYRADGRSEPSSPALSHRRIPTSANVTSGASIPTK